MMNSKIFAVLIVSISSLLSGCYKESNSSGTIKSDIDPNLVSQIADDSLFKDYAYAMNPNYRQLVLELNPVKSDQDTATNWRAILLVERRAVAKWRKLQQQYGLQGDSVAAQYAAAAYKQFFEKRFGAVSNKAMSRPGKSIKTTISREARTESFKEIMSTSQAAQNLQVQENDCSGVACVRPPDGYILLPPVEGQCCPKAVKFFTQKQADFMWDPSKREFAERLSTYLYKNDYSDEAIDIAKAWVDYLITDPTLTAVDIFNSWYSCVDAGSSSCIAGTTATINFSETIDEADNYRDDDLDYSNSPSSPPRYVPIAYPTNANISYIKEGPGPMIGNIVRVYVYPLVAHPTISWYKDKYGRKVQRSVTIFGVNPPSSFTLLTPKSVKISWWGTVNAQYSYYNSDGSIQRTSSQWDKAFSKIASYPAFK